MRPRLVGITGSLKGKVIPLTEGPHSEQPFSIGRILSNQLSISDGAVSRQHCLIRRDAETFTLIDQDSRNGTFVNGVPIRERVLEHGDQIKVGHCLLLFLLGEEEAAPALHPVRLADSDWEPTVTTRLLPEDMAYLAVEEGQVPLPATDRTVRDLSALLRISTALSAVRGLEELQNRLLDLIFEAIPADRGAIILVGENPEDFTSFFGRDRLPGASQPVEISRQVIDRALRGGAAVLSNGPEPGAAALTSLLVVPLSLLGRTAGVIYLDSRNPRTHFDESHLQLLTAIGSIAAHALENARRLDAEIDLEHDMIGESPPMREVYQFISRVAASDATVLIRGESGTGKELVARAIHRNSPRADQPFVAINCAALAETLLESEMFGHEKGSFTGAVAQKKGKLEVAEGGTVFLDEVGELAPHLQVKLLRVLQEREFERVGGTRSIKVDIRLIAATNKDLEEAVREKAFRPDLYYRLNVISLTMPPLRERRRDIPLLASYFADKYCGKAKRPPMGLAPEARACLENYDWPGNVRELENAIERAVVLGSGDRIRPENLPEALLETEPATGGCLPSYHEAVRDHKKQLILEALGRAEGSITEAAKLLGVHPNYLHRLIRNMNLRPAIKK
jgi:transcriptional regulator with GAF, ATPase, and Fis domain